MNRQRTKSKSVGALSKFSTILLITLTMQWMGCQEKKSDPSPSVLDETRAKLIANHWKIQDVNVDGVDQTSIYKGITIQFGESSFATTNGGAVWPSSGTWTFITDDGNFIKRDDGVKIKLEVTEASLKLTLLWMKTTFGTGRQNSVKGINTFTFVK